MVTRNHPNHVHLQLISTWFFHLNPTLALGQWLALLCHSRTHHSLCFKGNVLNSVSTISKISDSSEYLNSLLTCFWNVLSWVWKLHMDFGCVYMDWVYLEILTCVSVSGSLKYELKFMFSVYWKDCCGVIYHWLWLSEILSVDFSSGL